MIRTTKYHNGKEPLKNRLMRGSKPKFRETYRHTLSEILAKLPARPQLASGGGTKQEAFFRGSSMHRTFLVSSTLATLTLLAACNAATTPPSTPLSPPPVPVATVSSAPAITWSGAFLKGKHTVILKTNKGAITLAFDADAAPKTVTNFITLAKDGYYNGVTFHRVIPGFMIQGGDPGGTGTGGRSIYGEVFEDEIDPGSALYKTGYKTGVIAMANRGPNTNGSQFFIMDKDYPLPPNYTIFGHVTAGQNVVNTIARVDRDPRNDRPKEKVTFEVDVIQQE